MILIQTLKCMRKKMGYSWNGYGIDSIKTFLLDLQKIKKRN